MFGKGQIFYKSLLYVAIALLFYRIGGHTPVPFLNVEAYSSLFSSSQEGILAIYNMMSGGSLSRMSVFTLGIMPYISASIIVFMFQLFSEKFKQLLAREDGKVQAEQIKRMLTVGIVIFQSYALSSVLLSQNMNGVPLATISGFPFYVTTFLALLAGTFSCIWLANSITHIGFGSGVSILIMFGILSSLPANIVSITGMYENGVASGVDLSILIGVVVAGFFMVIAFENAERRISVIKPDSVMGSRKSYVPLKANPVGIMPPIFAAICLSMPISAMQMLGSNAPSFLLTIKSWLAHGTLMYAMFYAVLVFMFGFMMSKVVADPKKLNDSFMSQNYIVPTVRPGRDTENYLTKVSMSLTVISCLYMVILCSIPEFINYYMGLPLYLGGTSILIMVSTCSEMKKNIFGMLEKNAYSDIQASVMKI